MPSGPPRGGAGGDNDPGAHQRAHRNDTDKSVCGRSKTFFFEITSKSGENCGIFLFRFGVNKTRDA